MKRGVILVGALAAVVLATVFVVGSMFLGKPSTDGTQFRSPTGVVVSTAQSTGDAAAGREALLNAPYVSCGIPYDAYRRLNANTASDMVLPERSGRNADLPYALTSHVNSDGVEIVANNCLTCHAAQIDDQLIIGLGNEFGDFTQDPRRLVLQTGNFVRGQAETRAWSHWADRIEAIAPYIQMKTVGPNPATNLTWALMAHLNPITLQWSQDPLIDPPPTDPLPISVPPWWNMRKKNAMFYTTIGRGDHSRFMLLASMLCIDGVDDVDAITSYAADIEAFIKSLEAPRFPYPINAELAAAGEVVFNAKCSECHGTYGSDERFPNRVYPVAEVGTDPSYATEATNGARDRFYEWVARSPYSDAVAAPAPGYIAPPLDGIWATAPYLHNGSVPSMVALLSSDLRPTYWRHQTSVRTYDPDTIGWVYDTLSAGQDAEPDPVLRRTIYDTTQRGYGNQGHTYSDALTPQDKRALLEYLKSL